MATTDEIAKAEMTARLALLNALADAIEKKQGAWIGQVLNLAQAYAVVSSRTPGGAIASK